MNHCILVKWNSGPAAKSELSDKASALFYKAREYSFIDDVVIHRNCISRDNRCDLLIELRLSKDDLDLWDNCEIHRQWKAEFSQLISQKAIFDFDD